MGFTIPSSKNKLYLSGCDWVISALDYLMKKTTCAGNMSQVVLVLDRVIERSEMQDRLERFLNEFPVTHGSISRDVNLCPYWRMHEKTENGLNFTSHSIKDPSEDALMNMLGECANTPFINDSEHLAFHLIQIGGRNSCLAMTFDHRLLDARGAETFIKLFQQYLKSGNDSAISKGIPLAMPAHLSEWMKKFISGRNVNRKIVSLSKYPQDTLPIPLHKNKGFKFKLITFNQQETQIIYNNAYKEAGYLMEMPFLMAAVMQAVNELFRNRGVPSSSYLASASIDMRTDEDIKKELFFNHVSYLFFHIQPDIMENQKEIINSIKMQMYEQVKSGIPRDIMEASHLTRIAPLPFLKKIIDVLLKGKIATLIFSYVSKNPLSTEMMAAQIENIFHMPRVPVPPGLGFFYNYFNGRLNLVISYLDGLITDDEVTRLERGIKKNLMSLLSPFAGEDQGEGRT